MHLTKFELDKRRQREEYEELIKAKILFLNPYQAASHINEVYYDVNKWWLGKETKKIRDKFCHKYSKADS